MSSHKPTILIIGATGRTGQRVIDGLIDSGNYVGTSHLDSVPYPPAHSTAIHRM